MTPQLKFQRAKINLLIQQPFFGTLLLGLRHVEDKTGAVTQTMATDGMRLWWNPKFVDAESERAIITVVAHEVMHAALQHMLRRGERDPLGFNYAADHAVNLVLESCNEEANKKVKTPPFEWPKTVTPLKDPAFKGMSAEEIYALLPKQSQAVSSGSVKGQGGKQGQQPSTGMGDVIDAPADEAERQKIEAQWKVNVVQAAAAAKAQGKLPSEVARFVEEMLNPTTPWQELLRHFVRTHARDDYSWSRPNHRYAHTGFVLPSLYSQRLGPIAVCIDTSGSIDADLLNQFMCEVEAIAHETRPEKIILIDCDAAVHSVQEFEPTDVLPREFQGGGGTDFRDAITEALKHDPVCIIYMTDLYGTFPQQEPTTPVFWATTTDQQAPFGETVRLVGK